MMSWHNLGNMTITSKTFCITSLEPFQIQRLFTQFLQILDSSGFRFQTVYSSNRANVPQHRLMLQAGVLGRHLKSRHILKRNQASQQTTHSGQKSHRQDRRNTQPTYKPIRHFLVKGSLLKTFRCFIAVFCLVFVFCKAFAFDGIIFKSSIASFPSLSFPSSPSPSF